MRYARMVDGALTSEGALPPEMAAAPPEEYESAGYYAIASDAPPKPPDTATSTYARSFDVATRSIVWLERAKTDAELAAERQSATENHLRQQVTDHLADLRAITDTSGALTNSQLSDAVRALARGQIRLIRLVVGPLDGAG